MPMSDRLKQALRMTPRLFDMYTAIAIREVNDCKFHPFYAGEIFLLINKEATL